MQSEPKNLLIVEEAFELRALLKDFLESHGYKIYFAASVEEALTLFLKEKIELIISDTVMSRGTGMDLLHKVKAIQPDLPVILFLKWFRDASVQEVYENGGFALFAKPCDPHVFLKTVEAALTKLNFDKRQRYWRGSASFDVQIRQGEVDKMCRIGNMSTGGMFVSMRDTFPKPGEVLDYKILFSDGFIFHVEGQAVVRWVRHEEHLIYPMGVGVEFTSLQEQTKDKIWGLVNYLKTKQFIPKVSPQQSVEVQ